MRMIVIVGLLGVLCIQAAPTPSARDDSKSVTYEEQGSQQTFFPEKSTQNVTSNLRTDSYCPLGWKAPWQVGLLLLTPNHTSKERMCGGVLVHKRWVLTAASCVENTSMKLALVGSNQYLGGFLGKQGQVIVVDDAIIHEGYGQHQPPQHDIALLHLSEDAVLGSKVATARIPNRNSALLRDGTLMVITGWGRNPTKPINEENLHCMQVPLVSRQECEQAYGLFGKKIRISHLCSGGVGACNGDGGGGLVHVGFAGRNTVMGIISWSLSCGGHYTVHTNVERHRPWLLRNVPELVVG
ncbi:trypsin 5G1-like isoform X2 [Corticium candelabrum]|uniref:trypsin 5G1-like isoform X2 n=1 Tax=Corticium candelabrum TaxID=121492 RepID=UPI002E26CB84|nr:trypsin 5G1-like isoform X2 [Corticium candelabrum]